MWAPEMLLLLWEAILSNRNFLSYIIDTGRALDYMVLLIYYARQSQMEGIGRVCIFCLHTISAAKGFARLLDKPFQAQSTLPACMQIKNFQGRYSDYLILVSFCFQFDRRPKLTSKVRAGTARRWLF